MSSKQLIWHAYHAESLCQLVDLEDRRAEIEEIKPEYELPTRRRLMKAVVGDLPEEFVKACIAVERAKNALNIAWAAIWDTETASQNIAALVVTKKTAATIWYTAQDARYTAYQTHKAEIERLHAIECPDCPWDGETIFPMEVE